MNTRLVQKKRTKTKQRTRFFFLNGGHDAKIAYQFDLRYFQTANNALKDFSKFNAGILFPVFLPGVCDNILYEEKKRYSN